MENRRKHSENSEKKWVASDWRKPRGTITIQPTMPNCICIIVIIVIMKALNGSSIKNLYTQKDKIQPRKI